ncbi:Acyl-CoA synthetase (AMP-forming)/AMP-acid ligase II [Tardiphaga sp. OK246]|uniref:class I adenylate-forming enzyme family protein n=1 Tax=Tardiphaga sp. OK246 TaxID=1855307 RepID=UPI000B684F28|nr:AMP-binding protein [Tardiphaga sp. OK246]SNT32603.1 Acyl-CoA synthetase (AMP-forming)/AMP-acid ligase II [Tardiphaga sp. OK246]
MNIANLLSAAARSFADRPAISFGTELHANYGQFLHRVASLATTYRDKFGLQPGDRVALAMKNSPAYIEALYAIWHAGLCAVPINVKLHAREIAFILENSGAKLCWVSDEINDAVNSYATGVGILQHVLSAESAEFEGLFLADPLAVAEVAATDPAWLFYTSGTTGRPKGATISHQNLLAMSLRYYADIDSISEEDAILHCAPLSHASGLFSLSHVAHASHQIVPKSQGFDPDEVFELTHTFNNLSFFTAPTMLMRLVDHPNVASARLDAIKSVFYAGAPMYVEDLKRALSVMGQRLIGLYGQGETPNTISYLSKSQHKAVNHPRYEERLSSVGIPRTGLEVRIVGDDGKAVGPNTIGEVIVRSDITMSGYWGDSEATARALRDGWLYTGDLGVLSDDGYLTLKDRSKDLIISGGSNIYPREVEEVLLLHPNVLEVSIVGRKHPDWGEEVVAFVVPRGGADIAADELDKICLDHIARFKRPKDYVFLEALPKSAYGKILKSELRRHFSK